MKNQKYEKILSIIVPVYNVEKYLERCIDSLLDQDLPHEEYEIILINDGSTDNSYEIAKRLAGEHDNIVLLTQENQGLSGARNTGLEHAKGKYIMFVDSDDWIEEKIVGNVLAFMNNNQLDLCFYNFFFDYIDGRCVKGKAYKYDESRVYRGDQLMLDGMEVSSACRCMYHSEFLLNSGIRFTLGIYHEDIDFNYKLYPFAKRIMFSSWYVYHYRIGEDTILHTSNPQKLKKQIEGDLNVSFSIRKAIKSKLYSLPINKLYIRHTNSIIISNLLRMVKDRRVAQSDRVECFELAKRLSLYPIKGRTNSWKTTLLIPFLNCEWLYRYLLR